MTTHESASVLPRRFSVPGLGHKPAGIHRSQWPELAAAEIERCLTLGRRGAVALALARNAEALPSDDYRAPVHDFIRSMHSQRTLDVDRILAALRGLAGSPVGGPAAFFAYLLDRQREAWQTVEDILSGKDVHLGNIDELLDYAGLAAAFLDESDVLPQVEVFPSNKPGRRSWEGFGARDLRPLARWYHQLANAVLLQRGEQNNATATAAVADNRVEGASFVDHDAVAARMSEVVGLLMKLRRSEPDRWATDESLVTAWRTAVREGSSGPHVPTLELRVMETVALTMASHSHLQHTAARVCRDLLQTVPASIRMHELMRRLPNGRPESVIELAQDVNYRTVFWQLVRGRGDRLSLCRHADEATLFKAARRRGPGDFIIGRDCLRGVTLPRSLDSVDAVVTSRRLGEMVDLSSDADVIEARKTGRVLCVRLHSESPEFPSIPWELLSHNSGRSHFALDPMVRLTRCVPVRYALPPLTVVPPLRVMLVMASPEGPLAMALRAELGNLLGAFDPTFWDLQVCWRPSVRGLQRALTAHDPHVVHYIGHSAESMGEGFLILNAPDGGTDWLSGQVLSRMLPPRVRLLCLSAPTSVPNYQKCGFARIAHADLRHHLPTVVLSQLNIEREAARQFWSAFYGRIDWRGANVINAVHFARAAVACANIASVSWASFALVVRDGISAPFRIVQALQNKDRIKRELEASMRIHLANDLADLARSSADPGGARDLYGLAEQEAAEAGAFVDHSFSGI